MSDIIIQYLYEKPPFTIFAATKSRSASSSTMQASFPPSSIWRGTIPAFFEMAIPVSPPVKLRSKETNKVVSLKLKISTINKHCWYLPYAVDSRMHCKKITYFRTLPSHTTNQAFRETSQVEAVYHMKRSHCTLSNNSTSYKHLFYFKSTQEGDKG